jgi:hypothetical protein
MRGEPNAKHSIDGLMPQWANLMYTYSALHLYAYG